MSTKKVKNNKTIASDKRQKNYNKVVSCAELQTIQLISLNFKVSPEHFEKEKQSKYSYDISIKSSDFYDEKGFAMVFIDAEVVSKNGNKKIVNCKAEYLVSYENLNNCNEDAVIAFVERVSIFACYPYFRGLFSSLDSAAGTCMPPLPIHKEPK